MATCYGFKIIRISFLISRFVQSRQLELVSSSHPRRSSAAATIESSYTHRYAGLSPLEWPALLAQGLVDECLSLLIEDFPSRSVSHLTLLSHIHSESHIILLYIFDAVSEKKRHYGQKGKKGRVRKRLAEFRVQEAPQVKAGPRSYAFGYCEIIIHKDHLKY